jgi:hypothetical protein
VADGAARGGLALRDAESGLRWLASERGGHLAATESGELLYRSRTGSSSRARGLAEARRARHGPRRSRACARFIVRAWVSVVMVTYAVVFGVVAIALATRDRRQRRRRGDRVILQAIAESLYGPSTRSRRWRVSSSARSGAARSQAPEEAALL